VFEGDKVTDLIRRRYSCRSYQDAPIPAAKRAALAAFMADHCVGPFDNSVRLDLIAATADDQEALKGLGTYGFSKGATGYIAGAVRVDAPMALEDFGYVLEQIVLYATHLDLGTVWLGGTFTKSRFAEAIALEAKESLPAVVATGLAAERPRLLDALIRRGAGADQRLPWKELFFAETFGTPLTREAAGSYATPLEMVRLGPSASNKQPWRIVKDERGWHLYLQRSGRYRRRNALVGVADMQRIDMGIAMCHFALTCSELDLEGRWVAEASLAPPVADDSVAYIATWTT
jgi:nitroreductase